MYAEEECLPISALQHLLFCERQCALIHIEGMWAENRLTAEGRVLHDRAHGGASGTAGEVRTARALRLRSEVLGLVGVADTVEFHADGQVVPVEYKRGRSKVGDMDRVQLCAQAICLEEMLNVRVSEGALFYFRTRRRERVPLTVSLRERTTAAAQRLHALVSGGVTPAAVRDARCDRCSLIEQCMPSVASGKARAKAFFARELAASLGVPLGHG